MSSQHRPRPHGRQHRALTALTATTVTVALVLGAAAAATASDEPTPTADPTATTTPTESATPTESVTPTESASPTESATPTPTATATPSEPTVVFPEVTSFNPDVYEYALEVDAPEYTSVWAFGFGERSLAPQGRQVLDLSDGRGVISVHGCSTTSYSSRSCTRLGVSPELQVRSSLWLGLASRISSNASGTALTLPLTARWAIPDREGELSWSLRPAGSPDVEPVTGTTTYRPDPDADTEFQRGALATLTLPAPLAEGDYHLEVVASDVLDDFGPLEQASTSTLTIDTTAPQVWDTTIDADIFYPVHDNVMDQLRVTGKRDTGARVVVQVLDSTGTSVRTLEASTGKGKWSSAWNGRTDKVETDLARARGGRQGPMAEEGVYRFRAVAEDAAGNRAVDTSAPFRLSRAKVRNRWATLKLKPRDVLLDTSVGRCSRIVKKSTHGGRGTLSLQSQTRCKDPRQSHAVALFGAYLPDSYKPRCCGLNRLYERPQVSLIGGPAKNGPRSSYAVMGYVDSKNNFKGRRVFRGPWGTHAGVVYKKPYWIQFDKKAQRYYVLWQVGLSEGSRYDIKEFRVRVKAWILS